MGSFWGCPCTRAPASQVVADVRAWAASQGTQTDLACSQSSCSQAVLPASVNSQQPATAETPAKNGQRRNGNGSLSPFVQLEVGGEQITTTLRTLCAFEETYFSNLYASEEGIAESSDLEPCLVFDFDPHAFRLVLNALRVGVHDVSRSLVVAQNALLGEHGQSVRDVLDFLGLEWMVGLRLATPTFIYHTPLCNDMRKASECLDQPLGVFHELSMRDTTRGSQLEASHPDSTGGLWCSVEDLQAHQREWHYQSIFSTFGVLPLRRISKEERIIFDFGARSCVCPSEVILVIGVAICHSNSVHFQLTANSDFEAQSITLVKGSFTASDQEQHRLRVEVPEPRRHFYRMFSIRIVFTDSADLLVPSYWTLCSAEFFGDYLEGLPVSLFPHPLREAFTFDEASDGCKLITQI